MESHFNLAWKYLIRIFQKYDYHYIRSCVYNFIITPVTKKWYKQVLLRIPPESRLLDVGIGTAEGVIANSNIVKHKKLQIVGLDYDKSYLRQALSALEDSPVRDHVQVIETDFMEFKPNKLKKFDAVYFSGSFMFFVDQGTALKHAFNLLAEREVELQVSQVNANETETADLEEESPNNFNSTGIVYFTQTFEEDNLFGRWITPSWKKALRVLTTVDFGFVTYEKDFEAVIAAANAQIVERTIIEKRWNRAFVLLAVKPRR